MHEQIKQDLHALIVQAKANAKYYDTRIQIPQDENAYVRLAGQLISALDQFKEHHFAD